MLVSIIGEGENLFDFSPLSLVIGFIFGSVGFVYVYYGKRMQDFSFILPGMLLSIYLFAVDGALLQILIGLFLSFSPIVLRRYF